MCTDETCMVDNCAVENRDGSTLQLRPRTPGCSIETTVTRKYCIFGDVTKSVHLLWLILRLDNVKSSKNTIDFRCLLILFMSSTVLDACMAHILGITDLFQLPH